MLPEYWTIIGVILAAILGAIPGTYAVWRQRKRDVHEREKIDAEVTEILANAAATLVDPLSERVKQLECEIDIQGAELEAQRTKIKCQDVKIRRLVQVQAELCNGVIALIGQLESLGHIPVYRLKKGLCDDVIALNGEISS